MIIDKNCYLQILGSLMKNPNYLSETDKYDFMNAGGFGGNGILWLRSGRSIWKRCAVLQVRFRKIRKLKWRLPVSRMSGRAL